MIYVVEVVVNILDRMVIDVVVFVVECVIIVVCSIWPQWIVVRI